LPRECVRAAVHFLLGSAGFRASIDVHPPVPMMAVRRTL
jgi:hypothetical protein